MDPVSKLQSENQHEGLQNRTKSHRWKKGQSGNPGGRPKKQHITKLYEKLLGKSNNRKEISDAILETLTSKGMAKVLLLREMAERTEGKVAQEVDMNISGTLALAEVIQKRRKKRGDDDSRND